MTGNAWAPWAVAPASGFEVDDVGGVVGLDQIDDVNFVVTTNFRYVDAGVQAKVTSLLERDGVRDAPSKVADACRYTTNTEDRTDIASIPRFMRWFENTYGRHTLAAIIHDRLIRSGEPNAGALGSDTVSDTFFREMMRTSDVPWLERWIMWSAVALRTRWAAGGTRKLTLDLWIALAVSGIAMFVDAVGAWWFGWGSPLDPPVMLAVAAVLPLVAAPLWGRQLGAGLVAAAVALWILPPAILAAIGYVIYRVLEAGARRVGLT
jgi:hypothetical protein